MTRQMRQKYNNDCGIVALHWLLGIPYEDLLREAKDNGFQPNSGTGFSIESLLWRLGYRDLQQVKFGYKSRKTYKRSSGIVSNPCILLGNNDIFHYTYAEWSGNKLDFRCSGGQPTATLSPMFRQLEKMFSSFEAHCVEGKWVSANHNWDSLLLDREFDNIFYTIGKIKPKPRMKK